MIMTVTVDMTTAGAGTTTDAGEVIMTGVEIIVEITIDNASPSPGIDQGSNHVST
jgi:hypothetical protein